MKQVVLSLLTIFIALNISAQSKVDFFQGTWEEAFEKAKLENKHVFVDAYTDWCYWCKVMDKETFTDESIAAYLNKEFVPIKLNMEKDFGIEVAMKFRVRGFPTILYFNPSGELLEKKPGYEKDNSKFLDHLKDIRADEREKPFSFASQNFDLDYPSFIEDQFGLNGKKQMPTQDTVVAWLDEQTDLYNEVVWTALTYCPTNEKYTSQILMNANKYRSLYGSGEFDHFLISKVVYPELSKAGEEKNEEKYNAAIATLDKYMLDNEDKDDYKESFELNYLEATGDWRSYTMKADERLKKEPLENQLSFANSVAWTLYEECEDPECLRMMEQWMNKVIELDPQYMYVDTYAALLYKNGDYKQAKTYAEKAIEIGKAEESDTEETVLLLEKIQESLDDSK